MDNDRGERMQSKKGIYLLGGLIGTILIFFFILFFVHENTLENGILFKVSFEYENASNITYNFYNQNGKIEKVEGETSYLLEKTDYNSVKLLRKITKKIKETKAPTKEEGITIYNGQNKRYYLIPYNSEAAKELSSLIIDGYIHYEVKRTSDYNFKKEIYLYKENDNLKWSDNGSIPNIIHTYQCTNDNCKYIGLENNHHETILQDNDYYYYNYDNKSKEKLNVDFEITSSKFIKEKDSIVGLELQDNTKNNAYYDLKEKSMITNLEKYHYSTITETLLLKQNNTKKNDKTTYEFIVWDKEQKKDIWKKTIEDKNDINWEVKKSKLKDQDIYFLKRTDKEKISYYVLNKQGEMLLNNKRIELDETGKILLYEKDILKEGEEHYHVYDNEGNFIEVLSMSYAHDEE